MKHKEIQKINSEVVTDITCDICGKSCKVDEGVINNELRPDNGNMYREFEYMTLTAHWGYYSNKDMQYWEAHVCEKCVDEKFGFINFYKGKMRFSSTIDVPKQ